MRKFFKLESIFFGITRRRARFGENSPGNLIRKKQATETVNADIVNVYREILVTNSLSYQFNQTEYN